MLADHYAWLDKEPGPKMLCEALKLIGTHEGAGAADNPVILQWAREIGVAQEYRHDDVAWCGLFMALVAQRAGHHAPIRPLWALNWCNFGKSTPAAMLGDVLVFHRRGADGTIIGGHVGLYVGEDTGSFHVLGGNEADQVTIVRIAKSRLHALRRPLYDVAPANIRPIALAETGALSTNEA